MDGIKIKGDVTEEGESTESRICDVKRKTSSVVGREGPSIRWRVAVRTVPERGGYGIEATVKEA